MGIVESLCQKQAQSAFAHIYTRVWLQIFALTPVSDNSGYLGAPCSELTLARMRAHVYTFVELSPTEVCGEPAFFISPAPTIAVATIRPLLLNNGLFSYFNLRMHY